MNRKTYKFGLAGYPLKHSLSPRIHMAALEASNLVGEYELYPILPWPEGQAALAALLDRIKHGEIHGLNVTIPHKQVVLPVLDGLTPVASAIGAVNTIFREGGKSIGDNTDAPGFMADLERFSKQVSSRGRYTISSSKSALVLGAGGSSRAVVYALVTNGWQVHVAARRLEQAQELILSIYRSSAINDKNHETKEPLSFIRLEPTSIRDQIDDVSLIVNTTPLGMTPKVHASAWPADIPFPPGAIVYDLVYNPEETALVRATRAAGLPARTGLGMLIEQAALAFERWTGFTAPRQAMWDVVNE